MSNTFIIIIIIIIIISFISGDAVLVTEKKTD